MSHEQFQIAIVDAAPEGVPSDLRCRFLNRVDPEERAFKELRLQELLAFQPELLQIETWRPGIGDLICLGREVRVGSGKIDVLYLSTNGYVVCVETKLWRNAEARREVLSQVLDYSRNLLTKNYSWLEEQWRTNAYVPRHNTTLFAHFNDVVPSFEQGNAGRFADAVNRLLARREILLVIVGDGIQSGLQDLVDDICRDSPHMAYRLALVELACYPLSEGSNWPLVVVRTPFNQVTPIERAYVRIEATPELAKLLNISTSAERKATEPTEQEFIRTLTTAIGAHAAKAAADLWQDLARDVGFAPSFQRTAVVLRLPHPTNEEIPAASVLAIREPGLVYNPERLPRQLIKKWGMNESVARTLCNKYWKRLDEFDRGFEQDGIRDTEGGKGAKFANVVERVTVLKQIVAEFAQDLRVKA